jgi:hypothetical protein
MEIWTGLAAILASYSTNNDGSSHQFGRIRDARMRHTVELRVLALAAGTALSGAPSRFVGKMRDRRERVTYLAINVLHEPANRCRFATV